MLTPTQTISQTGDLGGQKVAMGFDENSLAHLMSVLTDLYSDKEMAVIREYATNARDSHIEAGNTAPIEVFTPSALSPHLRIVDHGVGLSVNDIIDMYSKYGASTKRGTNDQNGMLGIGAKSGLTLSPQFTLMSVKDGVKIVVSVSRSADGSGQMEIFDTQATTESNGVTISIPVNDRWSMKSKCNELFRFWEPGTVLVDGCEPERIQGEKVGTRFIINNSLNQDYVVMGNVPYPVKDGLYLNATSYYGGMGIVAFVDMGDVHFAPSREALQYTNHTRATLDKLRDEFRTELTKSAQTDMDTASSHSDAWERARKWNRSAGLTDLVYKGVNVPSGGILVDKTKYQHLSGYGSNGSTYLSSIDANNVRSFVLITNVPEGLKLTSVQRQKVRVYLGVNNFDVRKAVMTKGTTFASDPAHEVFLSDFQKVDWSDLVKIKISRAGQSGNAVVRTDPYDLYVDGYTVKQVSILDKRKPIAFYSTAEFEGRCTWMASALPDTQIVVLSKNRWAKFLRDYPTAMHYRDMIKNNYDKHLKNFTAADKSLWHYESIWGWTVQNWDHTRFDDPEVAEFIRVMNTKDWSDSAKTVRRLISVGRVPQPTILAPNNPLTKYPLADKLRGVDKEHTYWYFNTYFKEL